MSRRLPRYGSEIKRYRGPNPPPCEVCGAPASHKVDIQVSWFRGDDEVMVLCSEHREKALRGNFAGFWTEAPQ